MYESRCRVRYDSLDCGINYATLISSSDSLLYLSTASPLYHLHSPSITPSLQPLPPSHHSLSTTSTPLSLSLSLPLSLNCNCGKVTYYISGCITHKFPKLSYLDYYNWTYNTNNFQYHNVHLIFEMPPRKNQTFSRQQNI